MPTSVLAPIPQTYPELLSCVRRGLIDGQREIDRVWVRSYHETGRLITEHILLNDRADYGAKVFRLEKSGAAVIGPSEARQPRLGQHPIARRRCHR